MIDPETGATLLLVGTICSVAYAVALAWIVYQYSNENPDANRPKTRAEKIILGSIGSILIGIGIIGTVFSLMYFINPIILSFTISSIIVGIIPVWKTLTNSKEQGEVKDGI